jgi:hypothetical protein
MEISQLIGFVVMVVVLILPAIKKSMEEKDRKKNPEKYVKKEREQQRLIKELIHSIDPDYEDEEGYLSSKPQPPLVPRALSSGRPRVKPLRKRGAAPTRGKPLQTKSKVPKMLKGSVGGQYEFHSDIEDRSKGSRIEGRALESRVAHRSGENLLADRFGYQSEIPDKKNWREARAKRVLKDLPTLQDMLLLHEIILPAKGLQEDTLSSLNRE